MLFAESKLGIGKETAFEQAYQKGVPAMDIGGISGENGFLFSELPLGLGAALASNESAMLGYAGLSETEKEHLILRCKDARTKGEMDKIVASLVPSESIDGIAEEEKGAKSVREEGGNGLESML